MDLSSLTNWFGGGGGGQQQGGGGSIDFSNWQQTPNFNWDLSGLDGMTSNSLASLLGGGSNGGSSGASGAGGLGGLGSGLGLNIGTGQLGLGLLNGLGSLWTSMNAIDLAKKNYNLNLGTSQANLNNQTTSYNNNLQDRINSRYVAEGLPQSAADDYLASHQLKQVKLG